MGSLEFLCNLFLGFTSLPLISSDFTLAMGDDLAKEGIRSTMYLRRILGFVSLITTLKSDLLLF